MDNLFLKACRREATPRPPVWLMRQAGRYMKEYRAIREKTPFLELCRNVDLVTEVTVHAQEKIGADAAIIFSDILLIVDALGLGLEYTKGDGPAILKPIRSAADVERLPNVDLNRELGFVLKALTQTKKSLKPEIALLGFAGAPFTLASYMIEGGGSDDFSKVRAFMKHESKAWHRLLEKISSKTAEYLNLQIDAGADSVQLFDSWVGILTPDEYEKNVLPHSKGLIGAVKKAPVIHFGTKTGPFLESFAKAGAAVVGVDHRVNLKEAWQRIGADKAIQGNLDPEVLLKDQKTIKNEIKRILIEAGNQPGYIFNLGHGVLPETPVENVIFAIQTVKNPSNPAG